MEPASLSSSTVDGLLIHKHRGGGGGGGEGGSNRELQSTQNHAQALPSSDTTKSLQRGADDSGHARVTVTGTGRDCLADPFHVHRTAQGRGRYLHASTVPSSPDIGHLHLGLSKSTMVAPADNCADPCNDCCSISLPHHTNKMTLGQQPQLLHELLVPREPIREHSKLLPQAVGPDHHPLPRVGQGCWSDQTTRTSAQNLICMLVQQATQAILVRGRRHKLSQDVPSVVRGAQEIEMQSVPAWQLYHCPTPLRIHNSPTLPFHNRAVPFR
mmetsp:Transcript_27027/g.57572  ORF Transcript_27027/g.57572 Transcript_27027/m.57572 type:complete len:270 (+) Transcript_27027:292-1101(+)